LIENEFFVKFDVVVVGKKLKNNFIVILIRIEIKTNNFNGRLKQC
jgi:hypothetical protein